MPISLVKPAAANRPAHHRRIGPRQVAVDRIAELVHVHRRKGPARGRVAVPTVNIERKYGAEDRILTKRRDVAEDKRVGGRNRRQPREIRVEAVRIEMLEHVQAEQHVVRGRQAQLEQIAGMDAIADARRRLRSRHGADLDAFGDDPEIIETLEHGAGGASELERAPGRQTTR